MSTMQTNHLRIKGEKTKTYLSDLKSTKEGRLENKKRYSDLTEDDLISFTSDYMFKRMLCSEEYKMFICKLLSEITIYSIEYLMENAEFYKNELEGDSVYSKELRGDLIIKIGNKFILVEMDMKSEIFRNIDYSDRAYRKGIFIEGKMVYPEILIIAFENFSYNEIDADYKVFHIQDDEGLCLIPRTYMLVFLPKMLKRWYDGDVNTELAGFYRTVLTMYETSKKRAKKLAEGDKMMEVYVEEAYKNKNIDNGLFRAYDHELSMREDAEEKGREEGREEERMNNARALLIKGFDMNAIIDALKLSKSEIENLEKEFKTV